MGFALVLGFSAGLVLGAKYHKRIMPFIAASEAWVATWKQGLKENESEGAPKKGGARKSSNILTG